MYAMTPKEIQEWIKINIKDPIPMDDKSRLYEYLDVLSNTDSPIPYKEFALKGLEMIASNYSAHSIILCGALPLIRDQLNSPHPMLIAQSIRTLTSLANNGCEKEIIQEKLHTLVRNIVSIKSTPQYVKEQGIKFYFKMLDTPLDHGF